MSLLSAEKAIVSECRDPDFGICTAWDRSSETRTYSRRSFLPFNLLIASLIVAETSITSLLKPLDSNEHHLKIFWYPASRCCEV